LFFLGKHNQIKRIGQGEITRFRGDYWLVNPLTAEDELTRSNILLIRHSKYSTMLSKIQSCRLLFGDFAHWNIILNFAIRISQSSGIALESLEFTQARNRPFWKGFKGG